MAIAQEAPSQAPRARRMRRLPSLPAGLALVLYAFAASRLALLVVGLMTQIVLEPVSTQISPLHLADSAALRIWGQWDAEWYLDIARHGYAAHPRADGQANWAFFPAFPLVSAGLAKATGLPVFAAMVLLANASFLGALLLAHRLARESFDARTADLTVVLLCIAPGSYIYSSAYTESLFLLALSGCLVMLRSRRWLAAGGFAGLAVLTRNLGVALALPFVMAAAPELLRRWRAERPLAGEAARVAAGLAIPALALAGFCLLLYLRCGDPLAFVSAQKAWGRTIGNPFWPPIAGVLQHGALQDGDLINFVFAWLALGLLAALALMRRWSLLAIAAFLALTPLSTGLTSFARYSLVILPLFMAGARLLAPRPAAALAAVILFAVLDGFMMVAWTLGSWVTV